MSEAKELVILCGGQGTRLGKETKTKPKPLVEIGGKPILWHIMKIYSFYGINHFIICCGYKGYVIKEYFANYFLHTSDVTFHMDVDNKMEIHLRKNESWKNLDSSIILRCELLFFIRNLLLFSISKYLLIKYENPFSSSLLILDGFNSLETINLLEAVFIQ